MEKYYFDIEERLVKRVSIEAVSEESAKEIISRMYTEEMIVLTADDFDDFGIFSVPNPPESSVNCEIKLVSRKSRINAERDGN